MVASNNVTLQSMSVTTDTSGNPELIIDNSSGYGYSLDFTSNNPTESGAITQGSVNSSAASLTSNLVIAFGASGAVYHSTFSSTTNSYSSPARDTVGTIASSVGYRNTYDDPMVFAVTTDGYLADAQLTLQGDPASGYNYTTDPASMVTVAYTYSGAPIVFYIDPTASNVCKELLLNLGGGLTNPTEVGISISNVAFSYITAGHDGNGNPELFGISGGYLYTVTMDANGDINGINGGAMQTITELKTSGGQPIQAASLTVSYNEVSSSYVNFYGAPMIFYTSPGRTSVSFIELYQQSGQAQGLADPFSLSSLSSGSTYSEIAAGHDDYGNPELFLLAASSSSSTLSYIQFQGYWNSPSYTLYIGSPITLLSNSATNFGIGYDVAGDPAIFFTNSSTNVSLESLYAPGTPNGSPTSLLPTTWNYTNYTYVTTTQPG